MTVSTLLARIRAFFASLTRKGDAHLDDTTNTATATDVVATATADAVVTDAAADAAAAATGSDAAAAADATASTTAAADTSAAADQSALGAVVADASAAAATATATATAGADASADEADADDLENLSAVTGGTDELVMASLKVLLRFGLKLGHDLEDLFDEAYAEAKVLAAKL